MPRLRQVPLGEVTHPTVRYLYAYKYGDRDPVAQPGTSMGAPGNWETVFAQVPEVFDHLVHGFALYQNPAHLDPLLRELAQARVGWTCGSQFVFSSHCKGVRMAGGSDALVEALPHWPVADVYTPAQRAVLAYADCLTLDHGRTPDALFAELKRHLPEEAIIELTYVTSLYAMHAAMTRALQLEFDERPEPVVEVPAPAGFDTSKPPRAIRYPIE